MRYVVIGTNGEEYGPVDVLTLSQWVVENRLRPDTWLRDEEGHKILAKHHTGLRFPFADAPAERRQGSKFGVSRTLDNPDLGSKSAQADYFRSFNWGAFWFGWIWGVSHRKYLTLLIIPIFAVPHYGWLGTLAVKILFGIKGNRWAWESGRFATVDDMKYCQGIWANVGRWLFFVLVLLALIVPRFK